MSLALCTTPAPTVAPDLAAAPTATPDKVPPSIHRGAFRASARNVPAQFNEEWERLRTSPEAAAGLVRWASRPGWLALPSSARLDGLDGVVQYVQRDERTARERDEVLLHLLAQCQAGDRLAGRVVLQVMLPKAIRLARSTAAHPDWSGGPDEAGAEVVAALWVAIATYPLERRPGRVTGNLALDTLAIVQRGHTGSSWQVRRQREEPRADVLLLAELAQVDLGTDDPTGPADAELCVLLAWGVRAGVLQLHEAQMLARCYGVGVATDRPLVQTRAALAVELGTTRAVLRQRCRRLARRLRAAAIDSGLKLSARGVGSVLIAA